MPPLTVADSAAIPPVSVTQARGEVAASATVSRTGVGTSDHRASAVWPRCPKDREPPLSGVQSFGVQVLLDLSARRLADSRDLDADRVGRGRHIINAYPKLTGRIVTIMSDTPDQPTESTGAAETPGAAIVPVAPAPVAAPVVAPAPAAVIAPAAPAKTPAAKKVAKKAAKKPAAKKPAAKKPAAKKKAAKKAVKKAAKKPAAKKAVKKPAAKKAAKKAVKKAAKKTGKKK
jgi:hypothetical protein